MTYIGFSTRSHKILPRIFCRHFKHCAPIIFYKNKYILFQFSNMYKINPIILCARDLKILERYGWKFIVYKQQIDLNAAMQTKSLTCVQFTKKFCKIKNIKIQTPDALLKYIK